jgi:hypothetical protein
MTLQEIVLLMIEDGRYLVEKYVELPKVVRVKTHKKRRIDKKWEKYYGYKTIYETKKSKAMDVTIDNVVEFCLEKQIPLPDEFIGNNIIE